MTKDNLKIGSKYNWRNQPERLIYLGYNFSGNGFWHQFALVDEPKKVWSEMLTCDLGYMEETTETQPLRNENGSN